MALNLKYKLNSQPAEPDALLRIDKPNPVDIDSALRWSVDGNL